MASNKRFNLEMKEFSKQWFFCLDSALREMGLDSDDKSFDEIKENLSHPKKLSDTDFAFACMYVILAGGFSQKTAKIIYEKIKQEFNKSNTSVSELLKIFNNKNKIKAIVKIWDTRQKLCDDYYGLNSLTDKLVFLQSLPHIGKITANHLARNLGENVVKYDIWIQRLGCMFFGNINLYKQIDNGKLNPEIKNACDEMFSHLEKITKLPRGYIDVVLWKSCQNHLIEIRDI